MQLLLFQFHPLDIIKLLDEHLQQLKPLLVEPFDANGILELLLDHPPLVHQYALVLNFL